MSNDDRTVLTKADTPETRRIPVDKLAVLLKTQALWDKLVKVTEDMAADRVIIEREEKWYSVCIDGVDGLTVKCDGPLEIWEHTLDKALTLWIDNQKSSTTDTTTSNL